MTTLARIQNIPQYVSELRSQTGYYLGWIPNEYADQPTADSFYEILRKDAEINRCVHLLSLMAAGEKVKILCENIELKKLSEFILNQIRDFLHARKSLVEKGILFGLGVQRKYFQKIKYRGIEFNIPVRLQEVDRRRLRIERGEENKNEMYWTIWCPRLDQYIILEDRSENPNAPEGAAVQDYIWYRHTEEELAPYSEGFGDTLYLLAYIKSKVIQYWADLCESWSKPFLVAQIDLAKAAITAALGEGYTTLQSRINSILETFEKCRAKHIAVVDQSDKLQFFEHGTSGNNIIRELLEYCDKKIQLNILGSELSTTAGGVGSYALGAVHKEQLDTIVLYNRHREAEVLDDDILYDCFYRNRLSLLRLGLDIPQRGEVKIKIEVELEEMEKRQAMEKQGLGAAFGGGPGQGRPTSGN